MKETKTITLKNDAILIRMEPSMKAALIDRASRRNMSAAELVRWCLRLYFANSSKGRGK